MTAAAAATATSPAVVEPTAGRSGAYGLRLSGVDAALRLLVAAGEDWPAFELVASVGGARPEVQWVRRDSALLRLQAGGQVEIDRLRGRAVFTLPERPGAAELVHPYLASAAGIAAHWMGRESFHAGAIALDGGAWAVLGDKGEGKSSLLALLALQGHCIVSDDVLVLDGRGGVLAGPRTIDLRAEAAARLDCGEPLGVVGLRERWRLTLPATRPVLPLRGFVTLAWGEGPAVSRVPPAGRLGRLIDQRLTALLPPPDPRALIELGTLPMLELRRPREWDAAADAASRLLEALHA